LPREWAAQQPQNAPQNNNKDATCNQHKDSIVA